MKSRNVSARINDDLHEWLKMYAKARRISQSEAIGRALVELRASDMKAMKERLETAKRLLQERPDYAAKLIVATGYGDE